MSKVSEPISVTDASEDVEVQAEISIPKTDDETTNETNKAENDSKPENQGAENVRDFDSAENLPETTILQDDIDTPAEKDTHSVVEPEAEPLPETAAILQSTEIKEQHNVGISSQSSIESDSALGKLTEALKQEEFKLEREIIHIEEKSETSHSSHTAGADHKPALPPRHEEAHHEEAQERVHAVPPPLQEEMKSEEFRKRVALTHANVTPPSLPPRASHQRSESADFDLILNRFQENLTSSALKAKSGRGGFEAGANLLRTSFTQFLQNRGEQKEIPSEDEELEELTVIDWPFWTKVVNDYATVAKNESEELEKHVSAGIPPQVRGIIWQLMANSKSKEIEEVYASLVGEHSSHESAIKRDLSRTKFIPPDKMDSLFNVTKVYSLYDSEVGYIQGMAFIVTPLLLNCESDSEAFGLFVALMEKYGLRELFLPDMPGLHLKLYQFERLLEEHSPGLYNHLARQGIRSSMYASQWFLTFFAYKFPLGFVLRIYDIFMAEGMESLLKFSVVLMLKNEGALIQLHFDELLEFLKNELFMYYSKEQIRERNSSEGLSKGVGNSSTSLLKTVSNSSDKKRAPVINDQDYDFNAFVQDAMADMKLTPLTLRRYVNEYHEIHQLETQKEAQFESLRIRNKQLQVQIRKLETDYGLLSREHVTIANELIANRLKMETLQDENNDLRGEVTQWKKQLTAEINKQTLPNPDASLPSDIRADIDKTMARNLEVMNENQELQEKIEFLEKENRTLKNRSSPKTNFPPAFNGLKRVWK
ncbi:LAMI_0C02300g1_1 [Lachancea mirantina]|uniref:GTPase-activating protein GYP5 n=1 Tax=Lachancea mirantina TaxID=1230905 RepID=A0A1G4J0U3_9SACH|nr:LAMI_0C02300g1_1 [Lachancea mirantina]